MNKLMTIKKAEMEIKWLQHFINLFNSYQVINLNKWIIKEYARTNSINKVVVKAKENNILHNGEVITKQLVIGIINSSPKDELHKIVQMGYKLKLKNNRKHRYKTLL
ncbi:hypothetical protein A8F94_14355 [Bacillus sp. FJAT-27225]|uniref:hypothetical protein n=1 Tax=Bacillus sp. FJAT-27225 TaxID=1743144 RepID=UPI00080C3463|nr:hypothetical protein [Bacillus sp. FJAT-27225]OCA86022.1 hypothetical protein A8F94_14355 [Bacillus sp. FJAT-27225]